MSVSAVKHLPGSRASFFLLSLFFSFPFFSFFFYFSLLFLLPWPCFGSSPMGHAVDLGTWYGCRTRIDESSTYLASTVKLHT
ncbi:hypothetical protein V8C37DRAFT_120677 [Trichoderma ceciliae]